MRRQALTQGHAQAISEETYEDVRLNPPLAMVPDGAQVQVALERFEGRFDFGQLHILFPQRTSRVAGAKAAQEVMAIARLGLAQLVLQQREGKRVAVHRLARRRERNGDEGPGLARGLVRGTELVQ